MTDTLLIPGIKEVNKTEPLSSLSFSLCRKYRELCKKVPRKEQEWCILGTETGRMAGDDTGEESGAQVG